MKRDTVVLGVPTRLRVGGSPAVLKVEKKPNRTLNGDPPEPGNMFKRHYLVVSS